MDTIGQRYIKNRVKNLPGNCKSGYLGVMSKGWVTNPSFKDYKTNSALETKGTRVQKGAVGGEEELFKRLVLVTLVN